MRKRVFRAPVIGVLILLLVQQLGFGSFAHIAAVGAAGALAVSPATAEAGAAVAISGTGFAPHEALNALVITPYGQTLALVSSGGTLVVGDGGSGLAADGSGAFSVTLATAANYQPGAWTILVSGQTSGQEQPGSVTLTAPQIAAATLTPGASPAATPITPPARTTPAGEAAATAPATPAPAPSVAPTEPPATATPAPAVTPAASAAPSAAPAPSAMPSGAPTPAATPAPSATPSGSPAPAATPGASPSVSAAPSASPAPSASASAAPSTSPSPGSSAAPSASPSASPSPSPSPPPSPAPVPTEIGPGTQATVSSTANLRAAPSTSAGIVRSVEAGTVVGVTGVSVSADNYTWWPVRVEGVGGWIVADLLVLVAAPPPIASPSPAPSGSPDPGLPTYSNPGTGESTPGAAPVVPPPVDGPPIAPSQLLPTFAAASALTGVPQEILLAIGRVESNFTPSAKGPFIPQLAGTEDEHALGMMQFLPSTYRGVMGQVDAATGKNLGMQGVWDAESSIYAAAFYLQASGAPGDMRRALFSYNNANWYVELILAWASHYLGGAIPDPNLLDPSRAGGAPLAAPQNPLLPSNSRHLDIASPIQLYAPWTAGETWYVGGDGSYYGDGYHTDPLGNYYTVDFNKGTWPRSEEDDGAPILAAADGIVNNIYQDGAGAWVVELYHIAPDGSQLRTLYVHLKMDPRINPGLQVNQPVLHGTPIGLNGSTGNSTGSHLHFGVWLLRDGQWMSIRPEPMEGQFLQNGMSIVSTNRPVATDTGARALDFGLSPAGPSNADKVSIVAAGRADGLPGSRIDAYVNSARDGSDRGQWLPVGSVDGATGGIDWNTAPVAEGTYRLLFVQTDAAGNRTYHGLTTETAIRYTIRRGEPRAAIVANPRTDLAALVPLDGAALPTLGGRAPVVSGPLRFTAPVAPSGGATLGAGAVVAATGAPPTGKIREAEALLVEEGTTNLVLNPSFERGAEGWTTSGVVDGVSAALPSDSALFGKRSLRIDNSKGAAPITLTATVGDGSVATWSVYARAVAAPGGSITLGMSGLNAQNYPLTADWQRLSFSGATGTAGTERQIVVSPGVSVELDGAQLEQKPYATSYADGSLGSGYGWDRTADSSVSGRLPNAVRLPLDGLVTAESGGLAFWATPTSLVADGAVAFALGDRLTLAVAGEQATLRWGDEPLATMPWERGVTHHYALLWERGTLTFLRDGQVVGQRAGTDFALPTDAAIFLGSDIAGGRVINAAYQDLAVWHAAPTVESIAAIAAAGQFLRPGTAETVTLNVGLVLATQGLAPSGIKMQFSFDGTNWTAPEPFAATKELYLPEGAGEVRIYVRFTDEEGRTIVVTDGVQLILPTKPAEDTGAGR